MRVTETGAIFGAIELCRTIIIFVIKMNISKMVSEIDTHPIEWTLDSKQQVSADNKRETWWHSVCDTQEYIKGNHTLDSYVIYLTIYSVQIVAA